MSPRDEVIGDLNRLLRGWANYFSYGTTKKAYCAVDHYVYEAVRGFLRRRHKVPTRGAYRFSDRVIFDVLGVRRLSKWRHVTPTVSLS